MSLFSLTSLFSVFGVVWWSGSWSDGFGSWSDGLMVWVVAAMVRWLAIVVWWAWVVGHRSTGFACVWWVLVHWSDDPMGLVMEGFFFFFFFLLWFVVMILVRRGSWVTDLLGMCVWWVWFTDLVWWVLVWCDGTVGFWFGKIGLLVGSDQGCWGGGFWLQFVLWVFFFFFFNFNFGGWGWWWWLWLWVMVAAGVSSGYGFVGSERDVNENRK